VESEIGVDTVSDLATNALITIGSDRRSREYNLCSHCGSNIKIYQDTGREFGSLVSFTICCPNNDCTLRPSVSATNLEFPKIRTFSEYIKTRDGQALVDMWKIIVDTHFDALDKEASKTIEDARRYIVDNRESTGHCTGITPDAMSKAAEEFGTWRKPRE